MTSILQIEANRRNGRLSTGPRSPDGKRISRMNALKHGLTAQQVTLFDESLDDFQAFQTKLVAALQPQGAVELHLAERVALCAWRLRRVDRIETGLFRKTCKSWSNGATTETQEIETVFLRLVSQDDELAKLTRYETSIERSLQRALRALERRQAMRGAGGLFAPAVFA
jgi:hypothetical protein